jgi:DNA topoisomerase IB
MRLRRSDPNRPGYRRRGYGKGFRYFDESGRPLTDEAELARIKALVIPPAWREVWICPDPRGHIQAVGVDAAGRKQYRYHDVWRTKRDSLKFDHVLEVAARLPKIRRAVRRHLAQERLTRERVLAAGARLLDLGVFRVGGEEYARQESPNGETFGLTTLRRDHVSVTGDRMSFRYPAKGGVEREVELTDAAVARVVRALLRRRDKGERVFAYRERGRWREVRGADLNEYLREVSDCEVTAKDFRTWHATVLAAAELAGPPVGTKTGRRRAVAGAMRAVAEQLGNTPAVVRSSYVDPRVLDLHSSGSLAGLTPRVAPGGATASAATEKAVLELLT